MLGEVPLLSLLSASLVDVGRPCLEEISNQGRQLAILAPAPDVFPSMFERVGVNHEAHQSLMSQMQQLRGAVYLADGAIQSSDLDASGRHVMEADYHSFHLLAMIEGQVVGCCRFFAHQPTIGFDDLAISRAPLAWDTEAGSAVKGAVTHHIESARERGYLYVEVGGWALHPTIRHSTEAVRIARMNFSLGLAMGGAVGICTATVRNHSATILQRMGGRPLSFKGVSVPAYYDSHYGCNIEVVTFDSDEVPARHAEPIHHLQAALRQTPVLCSQLTATSSLLHLLQSVELEASRSQQEREFAAA